MGRVRYAKSLRDLERSQAALDTAVECRIRQIRCRYETDAEVAQAVVPRPLEASTDSRVHVHFTRATLPISLDMQVEVGVFCFGVGVRYEGSDTNGHDAIYPLMMGLTNEAMVIGGRERFGQPSKLAAVDFDLGPPRVGASVTRRGIRFAAITAEFREEQQGRREDEEIFCFKAFPGCQPGKGFDQDPQLVRLEWQHRFERVVALDGHLDLFESAFDPVIDLPVRRMARLEYCEGICRSRGRVLRPVPGEWLTPYLHQREDDPDNEGVDV
jgi:acetoacetate decarboxylase